MRRAIGAIISVLLNTERLQSAEYWLKNRPCKQQRVHMQETRRRCGMTHTELASRVLKDGFLAISSKWSLPQTKDV